MPAEITVLDGTRHHQRKDKTFRSRRRRPRRCRADQNLHHPQRRRPDAHARRRSFVDTDAFYGQPAPGNEPCPGRIDHLYRHAENRTRSGRDPNSFRLKTMTPTTATAWKVRSPSSFRAECPDCLRKSASLTDRRRSRAARRRRSTSAVPSAPRPAQRYVLTIRNDGDKTSAFDAV